MAQPKCTAYMSISDIWRRTENRILFCTRCLVPVWHGFMFMYNFNSYIFMSIIESIYCSNLSFHSAEPLAQECAFIYVSYGIYKCMLLISMRKRKLEIEINADNNKTKKKKVPYISSNIYIYVWLHSDCCDCHHCHCRPPPLPLLPTDVDERVRLERTHINNINLNFYAC